MTTDIVKAGGKTSLLATVAERYGMDPQKFADTLRATAFREVKTNEQFAALLVVAHQYGLNPLTKELYAFPDSKSGGVVPVVGVDGWSRIINEHPQFDGIEFRDAEATVRPEGGKVAPEWIEAVIYRKDRSHPTVAREYLDECYRPTGPWRSHTKRMLRHKALVQAARMAFGFAGIYDPDEAERIIEAEAVEVVSKAAASNESKALAALALEPEPEPIVVDDNGEVLEPEPDRGFDAETVDDWPEPDEVVSAPDEPLMEPMMPTGKPKASARQLSKVAVLLRERDTDQATVKRWMEAKWGLQSRAQLDRDQAGQLVEFLIGLPFKPDVLDGAA